MFAYASVKFAQKFVYEPISENKLGNRAKNAIITEIALEVISTAVLITLFANGILPLESLGMLGTIGAQNASFIIAGISVKVLIDISLLVYTLRSTKKDITLDTPKKLEELKGSGEEPKLTEKVPDHVPDDVIPNTAKVSSSEITVNDEADLEDEEKVELRHPKLKTDEAQEEEDVDAIQADAAGEMGKKDISIGDFVIFKGIVPEDSSESQKNEIRELFFNDHIKGILFGGYAIQNIDLWRRTRLKDIIKRVTAIRNHLRDKKMSPMSHKEGEKKPTFAEYEKQLLSNSDVNSESYDKKRGTVKLSKKVSSDQRFFNEFFIDLSTRLTYFIVYSDLFDIDIREQICYVVLNQIYQPPSKVKSETLDSTLTSTSTQTIQATASTETIDGDRNKLLLEIDLCFRLGGKEGWSIDDLYNNLMNCDTPAARFNSMISTDSALKSCRINNLKDLNTVLKTLKDKRDQLKNMPVITRSEVDDFVSGIKPVQDILEAFRIALQQQQKVYKAVFGS